MLKEKQIREREYQTLYRWFASDVGWAKEIIDKAGKDYAPLAFMSFHAMFFSVSHILSMISLYYTAPHRIFMFVWIFSAVWNGSGYYCKFFNYEKKEEIKSKAQQKL